MAVIAPCITVETVEAFQESIDRIKPFATRVHVDLSDGEFAPTFLVTPDEVTWPPQWQVDIHAMVMRPSEHLPKLIAMKPQLIVIHAESAENTVVHLQNIKQAGIKAGVALLRTTVPSTVSDAIKEADHVMIFSGDLGYYGGKASLMQVEKIRLVKAINPKVEIGWDGGVNIDNAFMLSQSGVDVLNTGGAIAKSNDPAATFAQLTREINKHGVI
ncbi:hypothetical protein B7Z00_02260 [Candidatus Saccharibacteria bacterium 32-50-10]|nr:MAG: hypothetical protein B7Z00_02260 [Candidatus Saccharibacteria bacterium 32-50-10]